MKAADSAWSNDSLSPDESADGWEQRAAAHEPATRPALTAAAPDASTPGPHAPELVTNAESIDELVRHGAPGYATGAPPLPHVPGYQVLMLIGRGGMGMVYEAVQLSTGRTVALKLVNPFGAHDPVTRERFALEVRTLAALKHPNIVPVYDAGDWHGHPYLVMEFAAGGTLSQHLDRVRADPRAAVRIIVKACRAVAAMHAAGVLHRDIKPLNILLGANDEPMVADFGLARWSGAESALTNTGLPVGTRQYMAPEQTHGRRTDYTPACDVWALGVTLYETLTGSRPFDDDGATDVYARIRNEDPPPVTALAPEVPAELAAVVLKCLEKRPGDRYASAAALAADLERWLADEPVLAPPAPVPAARPKPSRRLHAVLTTGIAAVAIAIVAASGVFAPGPTPEQPAAPEPEPPAPKGLAERVAGGEQVKLTDEYGIPTVHWGANETLVPFQKALGGYHAFSARGLGLVPLADENWGGPVHIEAEVAVRYETLSGWTSGGVYFGRRAWADDPHKDGTFFFAGAHPMAPEQGSKVPRVEHRVEAYWLRNGRLGGTSTFRADSGPWSPDGGVDALRFRRVTIDVRAAEACVTVDGVRLKPLTEREVLKRQSPGLPAQAPIFGTGIGVFCREAECVVKNLTVSKLVP